MNRAVDRAVEGARERTRNVWRTCVHSRERRTFIHPTPTPTPTGLWWSPSSAAAAVSDARARGLGGARCENPTHWYGCCGAWRDCHPLGWSESSGGRR